MADAPHNKIALVTGASSGFGLLFTVALARDGFTVVAAMRDLDRRTRLMEAAAQAGVTDRIDCHLLDVTQAAHIEETAAYITQRYGRLDLLVNNAGFAMAGFLEDVSVNELRRQFDTNFFGAAALTRAFLAQLKGQRFGHIVMVSSISGRVGFPGVGSYAASKFALEGWSETLRYEMKPYGVHVVLLEPGSFQTDIWTRNALVSERTRVLGAEADSAQGARIARWRARLEPRKPRPDAQLVADFLAGILANPRPRLRYSFGTDAWAALLARAVLPSSWFERIIIRSSGIED